jgi:hypothetical protein
MFLKFRSNNPCREGQLGLGLMEVWWKQANKGQVKSAAKRKINEYTGNECKRSREEER